MTFDLKLIQIYNAKMPLEKFLKQNLPIKTSFKLLKLRNKIDSEFEMIEKQRIDLVNKYTKDDKSEEKKVPVEKQQEFFKEWLDFLNSESISVDFKKIDIDELSDDILMTPEELSLISFIFDDFDNIVVEVVEDEDN
jgi:hypothetical protein